MNFMWISPEVGLLAEAFGDCYRSQWSRGLRRRSAAARLLRLWDRIAPGTWMSLCCEYCVLSSRGLCDELITRPEESCRLWCIFVCDLETSWMRKPWPTGGCREKKNWTKKIIQLQNRKITRVLKIQLFRDFLLYRLVNNYQISKDRDAFIFRVPRFFEISLTTSQLTQHYIPEDLHLQQSHNTRCLSPCAAKCTVVTEMTEWAVATARHVNCFLWHWLININILPNVVWCRRACPKVSELPIREKNDQ